jgi:membrane protein YdbS with pleckstrin-like domain
MLNAPPGGAVYRMRSDPVSNDMTTQPVDPATISVWRWRAFGTTAFLVVVAGVVSSVEGRYLWPMLPVLLAFIGSALSWFWPVAAYRCLRFGVDDAGIVIQRGVFFRSHIALPRVRIQHTDVSQGPLERRFGVGTLKFYTAGSAYTKIELPGLAHHEAVELRDALLAHGRDSGV